MKKLDVIQISNFLNYIKSVDKEGVFNYLILRNQLKFKDVIGEQNEIIKDLIKDVPKEEVNDELINQKAAESEYFQEWLKEDVEIEFYTMTLDKLENKEFDFNIASDLVRLNILIE